MIVLDRSAAMALMQNDANADAIAEETAEADLVLAPDLFKAERASAANRKLAKAGLIHTSQAVTIAWRAVGLVDALSPLEDCYVEALAPSIRPDHSPYGLFYLLLAKQNAAKLLTTDKALGRLCASEGVDCIGWE